MCFQTQLLWLFEAQRRDPADQNKNNETDQEEEEKHADERPKKVI